MVAFCSNRTVDRSEVGVNCLFATFCSTEMMSDVSQPISSGAGLLYWEAADSARRRMRMSEGKWQSHKIMKIVMWDQGKKKQSCMNNVRQRV